MSIDPGAPQNKITVVTVKVPNLEQKTISDALTSYMEGDTSNVVIEDFETFAARGRAAGCTCNLVQCVCAEADKHQKDCRFRKSLTCPIAFECKHGLEVCRECDPCTCVSEGEKTTP